MLEFLKGLFKKKEEEKPILEEDVPIDELSGWYEKKVKDYFGEMHVDLRQRYDNIAEQIKLLKSAVDELGLAQIKEKDEAVAPKIKNVVMGHRQNYIRLLRNTLVSTEVPADTDVEVALSFCDKIEQMMSQIAQNSAKSHYTAQHLFASEVEAIAKILKEIDAEVKGIKEYVTDKRVGDVDKIREEIKEVLDEFARRKEILSEYEGVKSKLQEFQELKVNTEERISSLQSSDDFVQLKKEQNTLRDVEDGINRAKRNMMDLISPLESSLRKYSKIASSNEKLIESYASNPVKMLIEDKQLEIVPVLSNMKSAIQDGSLEMKDDKKAKVLSVLDRITKSDFEKVVGEYTCYLNRKNELLSKVSTSSSLSERRQLDKKLEDSGKKIIDAKVEVERVEKALSQLHPEEKLEKIEKELSSLFESKVNVFTSS